MEPISDGNEIAGLDSTYLLFLHPGAGVMVEHDIRWSPDDLPDICGPECFTSTTDIYEMRWSGEPGAWELETPAPDPRSWSCSASVDERVADCTVTHLDDGTTESLVLLWQASSFEAGSLNPCVGTETTEPP